MFKAGLRKPIDEGEIYESLPEDGSAKLSTEFDIAWQAERLNQQRPNLFRVMRKTYCSQIVPIGVMVYILDIACRCVDQFSNIYVVVKQQFRLHKPDLPCHSVWVAW